MRSESIRCNLSCFAGYLASACRAVDNHPRDASQCAVAMNMFSPRRCKTRGCLSQLSYSLLGGSVSCSRVPSFFSARSPVLPAPIVDAAKFNFLSDQAVLDHQPLHSNFHCSLDKQKALHRGLQDSYISYKGFVRALSTSCPLEIGCGELPPVQEVPTTTRPTFSSSLLTDQLTDQALYQSD